MNLSTYAKLLIESELQNQEYLNFIKTALVSLLDIDNSDIANAYIKNRARNANFYHNHIWSSYAIRYRDNSFLITLRLFHRKVPEKELPTKQDVTTINILSKMQHVELTKDLLKTINHLVSFDAACYTFYPDKYKLMELGFIENSHSLTDVINKCKKIMDNYIDGQDNNNSEEPAPTPVEPSGKLVTV